MSSQDRPPFILCFAADMQGCAHHRISVPLASLCEAGAADGRIDLAIWPDEVGAAARPDVVVWQRQVEDGQVDAMRRWRQMMPDALFVYELDDYLGEIPRASFHRSFMPSDIGERVGRALAFCDRVTTTTEPMAEWLRSLGGKDVRVVPNGIPQARLREREPRPAGQRIRVGWAGGMSHAGDLEILRPAMAEIGDDVTWVFMGMQPEDPPVRIEYHEGVPVVAYLDAMAALDVDVMLAPLEDNAFNRCKSNLRLLEAAACGACVIAQDLPTYRDGLPPVWTFPSTPEQWTKAIRSFAAAKPAERRRSADALRAWVGRKYTLERLLPLRAEAWLPPQPVDGARWKPRPARERAHGGESRPVLACLDAVDAARRMPFMSDMIACSDGLEAACRRAIMLGTDVLWLRPATTMTDEGWHAMRSTLAQSPEVASAVPIAADGVNGFPLVDRWSPMPPPQAAIIDREVRSLFRGRRFGVPVPTGPCVLLSRHALSMLGAPDVVGCDGNEEQAILEWGARAASRRWRHMQAVDAYASSVAPPAQPTQRAVQRLQARGIAGWVGTPAESFTPDERESLELALLRLQWGGPRPGSMGFGNDYVDWKALCDCQEQARDRMVKSRANDTDLVELAFGQGVPFDAKWVIYSDDAVLVHGVGALREAVAGAADDVEVVYADHESILSDGKLLPEFKPDFDLELFLAQDYVTPVCAVRAYLVSDRVPQDRNDLYRLVLHVADQNGSRAFLHVPKVLGAMKVDPSPERDALDALARQVAIEDLYGDAVEVHAHRGLPGCLVVKRRWQSDIGEAPMVSVVVPTLGNGRLIQPCVATVLQHTRYPNYEVVVVQNGDQREEPELSLDVLADERVRVVRYDGEPGFNWSRLNNWAVREHCRGEYVLALNDDVCVSSLTGGWLDAMMGQAVQPDVGVVGARLLHPMGVVQHAGVVCHRGIAGHMHKGLPNGQAGHMGRAILTHEASAVTGACMLFSRAMFDAVGGFREDLSHNYGDTAFCLSARALGLRVVMEGTAELLHPEGTSRPSGASMEGMRKLVEEGVAVAKLCPGDDPYWSPSLGLGIVHGGLMIQGLDAMMLSWRDFEARDGARRVLLVNDLPGSRGRALSVLRDGDVPYGADLSGFRLRLSAPNATNVRPWDVRRPAAMADALRRLGIDRVVLRSLVGAEGAAPPVETLRAFAAIGIEVEVDPVDPALMTPWDSPEWEVQAEETFGGIHLPAWRAAYESLVGDVAVKEAAE